VLTIGLSSLLQGAISRPILALARTARAVSERRDYSVRATRQGADEIGGLTDAFNQMLAEIELGQRALQEVNQSLRAQAGQVVASAALLGAAAHNIMDFSTQVAASAAQTATAVNETTTTVEEVRQTAQISSQKAKVVAESARKTAETSQSGRKATEETVEGMRRIRQQMETIAETMLRLSDQTQAIGQVIASVDDLAAQSNLLAVNAAIEAAKAGEQGRGFAVVAQEIKSLAEQSKQATNHVRTILRDIQAASGAAVRATEQGTKAVEAGVRQSAEAGASIQALAGSVTESAQAATQIATTSEQQLIGMGQVASAMESIRQASAQNVASAKQLEASARNLNELGQKLRELVETYRVQDTHS
jgi:methyl-accepting chemotaxis protein